MTATLSDAERTTRRYREGGENGDVELVLSTMAADVVLHSPLTARARFTGREQVRPIVEVALAEVADMRFHTDTGDERTRTVVYRGRVGGVAVEEAVLLRLNDEALIAEATLFVRPLPGAVAMMRTFGPAVARAAGKRRTAAILPALTKPLVWMVHAGDRMAANLVPKP